MSKPIEPGCLARVIASRNPENLGALVKVLQESAGSGLPAGASFKELGIYFVRSEGGKAWLVQSLFRPLVWSSSHGRRGTSNLALYPDHKLERIDDISDDEPDTLVVPLPSKESTYAQTN